MADTDMFGFSGAITPENPNFSAAEALTDA
jgi:hypothetical protein